MGREQMIEVFERAALAAGRAIMDIYHTGPNVMLKADASPVTEADQRAEAIILADLAETMPEIPVVAEESVAAGQVPETGDGVFILVDPLDGTKEFINRRPDFTVNIALIEAGRPVMGVVFAPASGQCFIGSTHGAEKLAVSDDFTVTSRRPINVRKNGSPIIAVVSRSHCSPETGEFLQKQGITTRKSIGSSLKFCLLAEGDADVYPRFSRTMEWDTAAGDAVLRAAGGQTVTVDGMPLTYGKRNQASDCDFANPFFIAKA